MSEEEYWTCDGCHKEFPSKLEAENHERKCSEFRNLYWTCDGCQKEFRSEKAALEHEKNCESYQSLTKYCTECGEALLINVKFCSSCSYAQKIPKIFNQEDAQIEISNKQKTVAGILGILLGGLGIHRFYMGYIGIGILQIILTILTLGLASFWGLIEGILILVQNDWTDSEGRLLKGNERNWD